METFKIITGSDHQIQHPVYNSYLWQTQKLHKDIGLHHHLAFLVY